MKNPDLTDIDQFKLMIQQKRFVVRISLYLGVPLLCALTISNLIEGDYFVALLTCAMLLIVVFLGYGIKGRIDEEFEYKIYAILSRLFNAAVGIALLYEIGFQSNFSRMGWCYIYPVLIFFVVGVMEGMIWVFIFYGILAFSILNIDLQGITLFQIQELRLRFLVSFFVVCMLSLFLAHGFRHAQQRLLRHQRVLKESESRYRQAYEQLNTEMQERKRAEEALRESEDRFRELYEHAPIGYHEYDIEGRITNVNLMDLEMLGYTREEMIGHYIWEFNVGAETVRQQVLEKLEGLRLPGQNLERIYRRKDGTTFPALIQDSFLLNEQGKITGIRCTIQNITERKRAEEKLRESEERFRELAEKVREVFYISEQGTTRYVSPAYEEIWGRTCQSLYKEPQSFWDTIHPEDKNRVMRSSKKKNQEEVEEVYRIVRPDGSIRWIKERSFPVYDNSGKVHRIVGFAADITDLKLGEEKMKYLSLHDSLTGLYNRIFFEEEMSRIEKARYDTVGIVSCDVDGLKLVNDTLGHDHGDNLLLAAARVLRESFREGDLVARIGGDEFSVLLPNATEPDVENACQRIQEAVAKYNATNPELPLSISLGFAVKNENGFHKSLKDAFKEADNNMYRKKLYRTQSVRSTIVNTLINTLKARDLATEQHVMRLEKLLVSMAALIALPESAMSDLSLLGKFHDIGKVGISDSILFKEGPLTPGEWTEMKRHCEIGYRIALSALDLVPIADWILKHHEWWNGGGYPLGIKGEEIPIECRLLAIADAYEAMTSVRPYRRALSHEEAIAELLRCSGTQFDPNLVEKFLQILETHPPKLLEPEASSAV
jgi:diguanylate cyclase (GGDEF)-like protein/PAS domain S-box-containing protein